MKTIRYCLSSDVKYLYKNPDFNREKYVIPHTFFDTIFLNILEKRDSSIRIKIFLPNGECQEGWVCEWNGPFKIHNMEELFDGRFNQ